MITLLQIQRNFQFKQLKLDNGSNNYVNCKIVRYYNFRQQLRNDI